MIPDDSVEIILAHHILEHIGSNYIPLLKELYRVAKHKAIIDIRVPHPNHEIFLNDPTHKRPITVEGLRLFSKQYNLQEIQRGGSSSTLGIMNDIDFEIVHFDYIHDPYYDNIKTTATPEQLERIFRSEINTTLEIHVVLTVIKNV
jgi:ubiquinone/menaquinone biosynthesis C-methylase UbiE